MLLLIKKAHQSVKDKFQINLELEVKLMGFNKRETEGL
jgi:UDP-N-acetylenolpyruvoylglucosamine reductase